MAAVGRPSIYTNDIAEEICNRLAVGESLRRICADSHTPSMVTVFDWLHKDAEFANRYARAREEQAESYVDRMLETAVSAENEDIQKAKLIIDTMKWTASKLKPKRYGDKLGLTDGDGGPLQIVIQRFGEDK